MRWWIRAPLVWAALGTMTTAAAGVPPQAQAPLCVQQRTQVAAFARLYGVVRYFYPGDGAQQVDWNRLAVLGAGEAARRLVGAIHRRDGWTVLALLDDDPAKQGLRIGGVTVQGSIADVVLPHLLAGATHVIVAMPGAPAERRAQVIELARQTGLPVLSVPSKLELHDAPEALPT